MIILTINTKGGSGKSTASMQVLAPYFLSRDQGVTLVEMDNENQDAENFGCSIVVREQFHVDAHAKDVNSAVRDLFLYAQYENMTIDVGGNRTTNMILEALTETKLHRMVDLYVIPISSAYQDLDNAIKTMSSLKEIDPGANICFAISRSRHPFNSHRLKFQFARFFKEITGYPYFVLSDSDVIDLSRLLRKTVFELACDQELQNELETQLDQAFDVSDKNKIYELSTTIEILEDAKKYYEQDLKHCFLVLDHIFKPAKKSKK